jgi:uncharacterized membrane protein YdbT with pleckstrin-like domain
MRSIDNNLLPGEQILFRTKKHVMVFFYPLLAAIVGVYAYNFLQTNPILAQVAWVPGLVALIFWLAVWLEYLTSEFIVTNKRIIMREGFFFRHTAELRVNTISQINISQNLMGQLLDYGTVSLNTFGAFDIFTMLAHPYAFRRFATEQTDKANSL